MVVGPHWAGGSPPGETPPGIKQTFASSTDFALTIFRTQLFNPEDMPNVVKVQAGYKAQPLSAFLKQPAPPAAPASRAPPVHSQIRSAREATIMEGTINQGKKDRGPPDPPVRTGICWDYQIQHSWPPEHRRKVVSSCSHAPP